MGIIISLKAVGQNPIQADFNLLINHAKKGHSNIVNAEMAIDSIEKNLVLFLQSKTKSFIHVFSKEEEYKPTAYFEFYNDELNTIYPEFSVFQKDNLLFLSSLDGKISLNTLNLKSGKLKTNTLKSRFKKSTIFGVRVYNNSIFLLGGRKNEYIINIMQISGMEDKREYQLSYTEEGFINPKWFFKSPFNRYSVLSKDGEIQFTENVSSIKQYNKPKGVLLSINKDSVTYTMDISFDTEDMTLYKNTVTKSINKLEQMNSYIYDQYIFQTVLDKDKYWIEIKNLKTNVLLSSFSLIENDSLNFSYSSILQEGGKFSSSYNPKLINKSKTLFKAFRGHQINAVRNKDLDNNIPLNFTKIKPNYLTLSVKQLNANYILTLGSVQFMADEFSYLKGSPLGTDPTNSTLLPKYFPYFYRTTKFAMLLDEELQIKTDFVDLDGLNFQSEYRQQIESETAKLVLQLTDKVFLGYFDYKNQNYVLKAFNKEAK